MAKPDVVPQEEQADPAYETSDVGGRTVATVLGIFTAVIGLTLLGGISAFYLTDRPIGPKGFSKPAAQGPGTPRLQRAPAAEFARYRTEQQAILRSYGWVNRGEQIVRIPIAKAMKRLARAGWPRADGPAALPGRE